MTKWYAAIAAFALLASAAAGTAGAGEARAAAAPAMANGETLRIQNYPGTTGNMFAVIAVHEGFCTKHGFTCELKSLASGPLGLQALVGKTIDVAQPGMDNFTAAAAHDPGLVAVADSLPDNVFTLVAGAGVKRPHQGQPYPAVMQDFKGLKVGVPARGSAAELMMDTMLQGAGLSPSDVTYVAVGGPATAYTALAVGRQIDAVVMFQPMKLLCLQTRKCDVVVDLTVGQGPASLRALNGAYVPLVMRREMVQDNPKLVKAFLAAMRDAQTWVRDPANFDALVKIYTPLIGFGNLPDATKLRVGLLKAAIPFYDLRLKRSAVAAMADFMLEHHLIAHKVDPKTLVWDQAP